MVISNQKPEAWIGDLVGALCDPIIVFPSPWQDDIPDWVKSQITLERLVMNIKVMKEGGVPVGGTEVLAYMFPRTMDAPMPSEWTRIYFHCFNEAMQFKKVEVPEDLKAEKLSEYELDQLNHLKHWIYEQRVKHRKEKARVERRQAAESQVHPGYAGGVGGLIWESGQ